MKTTSCNKNWVIALTVAAALLLASCGGGGGGIPGGNNTPAPGTADLQGQLVQGSGARATSAVGDSLPGIAVQLINALTGQLQGTDITDGLGKFEFKAIPSGQSFLVKVEFTSSQDLDGNGVPDRVELLFPVSLADQSIAQLIQQISLDDTDADNKPDAVEVEIELSDDHGRHENHHRQHRHGDDTTVEDSNHDGQFEDNDDSFDDHNHDGLPDDGAQLGGAEVRGAIEALSADSITVAGKTFTITSATEWQLGANHHATSSQFAVGQLVKVEGFTGANGSLIAHEVKDSAADDSGAADDQGDDNGGDDAGDDNGGGGSGSGGGGSDDGGGDDGGHGGGDG